MGKSKGKGNRKSRGGLAGGSARKLTKAKAGAPNPLKQIRLTDAGFAARLMGKYAWHAGAAGGRRAELHHRTAESGTQSVTVPLTLQLFLRHVELNLHLLAEKMRPLSMPAIIVRQETRRLRGPDSRPTAEDRRSLTRAEVREPVLRERGRPAPSAFDSAAETRQALPVGAMPQAGASAPIVYRPREARLTHRSAESGESVWRLWETILQYRASFSVIREIALHWSGRTAGAPLAGAAGRREPMSPALPWPVYPAWRMALPAPSALSAPGVYDSAASFAPDTLAPLSQAARARAPQMPPVPRRPVRTLGPMLSAYLQPLMVHRLAFALFAPEMDGQIRIMERLRLLHGTQESLLAAAMQTAEEFRRAEERRTGRAPVAPGTPESALVLNTIRKLAPVLHRALTERTAEERIFRLSERKIAATPLEMIYHQLLRETVGPRRRDGLLPPPGDGPEGFPGTEQSRTIRRLLSSRIVMEHMEAFIRKAWRENRHLSVTVRLAEQISQFVRKQTPFFMDIPAIPGSGRAARRLASERRAEMLLARPTVREAEAVIRLLRHYLNREEAEERLHGRRIVRLARQETGRETDGETASVLPPLSVRARTAEPAPEAAAQLARTAARMQHAAPRSFLKAENIAATVQSALSLTVSVRRMLRLGAAWTGITEDQGPAFARPPFAEARSASPLSAWPVERVYLAAPRAFSALNSAVMAERAQALAARLSEPARRIAQRAELAAGHGGRETERSPAMAERRSALTHRAAAAPDGAGETAEGAASGLRAPATDAGRTAAQPSVTSPWARTVPAQEQPQPFRSAPRRVSQVHVTRREPAAPDANPDPGRRSVQAAPRDERPSAAAGDAAAMAAALEAALGGLQVPLAVRRSLRALQDVRLTRMTVRGEQNLFIHRQIFRRFNSRTDIYDSLISDTRVFTPSPAQSAGVPFVVARSPQPSAQPAPEVKIEQRHAAAARMEVAAKRTIAADYEPAIKALQTTIRKVEEDLSKVKSEWKEPRQPDIRKLTDEVYKALTSRLRFEQQKRGL